MIGSTRFVPAGPPLPSIQLTLLSIVILARHRAVTIDKAPHGAIQVAALAMASPFYWIKSASM